MSLAEAGSLNWWPSLVTNVDSFICTCPTRQRIRRSMAAQRFFSDSAVYPTGFASHCSGTVALDFMELPMAKSGDDFPRMHNSVSPLCNVCTSFYADRGQDPGVRIQLLLRGTTLDSLARHMTFMNDKVVHARHASVLMHESQTSCNLSCKAQLAHLVTTYNSCRERIPFKYNFLSTAVALQGFPVLDGPFSGTGADNYYTFYSFY